MKNWIAVATAIATTSSIVVSGTGAQMSLAQQLSLPAVSDAYIRTDLDVRRNDNYGCQQYVEVGTGRGGGGIPFGGADAMRGLIKFDLSPLHKGKVKKAILELTLLGLPYDEGNAASIYTINVHRVLANWQEGNGTEDLVSMPSSCTGTDPADGVAWAGAGDNSDPAAANNQTQPPFDPTVIASTTVKQNVNVAGNVIQLDITPLVQDWAKGKVPNYGILLRDPTPDGTFRGVRFGSREGLLFNLPYAVAGPRLVVTRVPTMRLHCERSGWLDFGFKNQRACTNFVETHDHEADH